MAKGEPKGNRESKKPKKRKGQNNRCSAESKARYSGLAADVRIGQEEIETNGSLRRVVLFGVYSCPMLPTKSS